MGRTTVAGAAFLAVLMAATAGATPILRSTAPTVSNLENMDQQTGVAIGGYMLRGDRSLLRDHKSGKLLAREPDFKEYQERIEYWRRTWYFLNPKLYETNPR